MAYSTSCFLLFLCTLSIAFHCTVFLFLSILLNGLIFWNFICVALDLFPCGVRLGVYGDQGKGVVLWGCMGFGIRGW